MGLIDSKRVQRLYDQVVGNRKNCAYEDLERLLKPSDSRSELLEAAVHTSRSSAGQPR